MSQIWLTADLHLGHANIARLRGFDDVDEHDEVLAANWDRVIKEIDQVWVLGDVSMSGTRTVGNALYWIADRPGIKHLIAGNHDSCHPMHHEAHKWQRVYLEVFKSVQQSAVRKVDGNKLLLSHFPYANGGDHTIEERYTQWRFQDAGLWLIHGHTHSSAKVRCRQIHVGVDAHDLAPVSANWVDGIVREGAV